MARVLLVVGFVTLLFHITMVTAQLPAEQLPAEQLQAEQLPAEQLPAEQLPEQPECNVGDKLQEGCNTCKCTAEGTDLAVLCWKQI